MNGQEFIEACLRYPDRCREFGIQYSRSLMEESKARKVMRMSSLIVAIIIFVAAFAQASERDQWEIDIAEAAVWCAQNQFPALDADQFKFANRPPEAHDATDSTDATGGVSPISDGRSETPPPASSDTTRSNVGNETSQTSPVVPMKLTFESPVQSAGPTFPRAQLVIETTTHCPPCERQKNRIVDELTPLGWKIGSNPDDHIQIVLIASVQDQTYPTSRLYQRGELIQEWSGYTDPATLSRALRKAWDSADESPVQYSATGSAGSFHGRAQIRQAKQYLRQYIGAGNTSTIVWDRNGERAISLFALKDASARDIFGTEGRISVESPSAVNLPIKEVSFTYRIRSEDIDVDFEKITLKGYARKLSISQSSKPQAGQAGVGAVGFFGLDDLFLADAIFNVIRDILSILNPTADVQLGDTIQANCILDGERINVTFDKGPAIRLKMLFTFQLVVKRVEITEQQIRVVFSGSRFVKERTFKVEE
jgi:hypothetical protein